MALTALLTLGAGCTSSAEPESYLDCDAWAVEHPSGSEIDDFEMRLDGEPLPEFFENLRPGLEVDSVQQVEDAVWTAMNHEDVVGVLSGERLGDEIRVDALLWCTAS